MSIKHFIQEIEKGLSSPAYFLHADDPYLLKEASLMSARTIPEGERDFSLNVFDLDGVDEPPPFRQILDVVNTVPFMTKHRIVIIEGIQELAKKDMVFLSHYLDDPSPYSVLMLFHKGSPKAQFREVVKKMKSITLDIRPQELSLWIKEKARRKGLEVTDDAIEYLVGAVGPDAGLLASEIEKFALTGKSRVSAKDVMDIVKGNNNYDAFDLVNALRDRDAERAFSVARGLQETQESFGLLGAINWHYSRMSSQDKSRATYYRRVFELLNETDIGIKRSGGTFPLEYLLVRLLRL